MRKLVTTSTLLLLLGGSLCLTQAQNNVLQPGDPAVASSSNSPGSEGVANAFDGTQAKYLNFDQRTPDNPPTGFVVSPSVGATWVTGMALQSANDAPERDPKVVTLEGSNDESITDFASGNWAAIATVNVPVFADRYAWQSFTFENFKPYLHYRWTVVNVQTNNGCCMQVAEVQLLGAALPPNVVQPGDPAIASSSNSPGSEGVANAIDGTQAKYLNFDQRNPNNPPTGLIVTPSIGATVLNGLSLQAANDAPERDPKNVLIEGSNDDTVTDFASGNWTTITTINDIPPFAARYAWQTFLFDNVLPFKHYRWTVLNVQTNNGCCMQIAEVEFLGSGAPQNVVQPGDPAIASSSNSPGSEGVANAIDGSQAKYLNFDQRNPNNPPTGFVVTPSVGPTIITGLAMQSANDAPERDPKNVLVEGSNDETIADFASGTWTEIVTLTDIPPFAARYAWQEFYFPNKTPFKHYRWTVLNVQTNNGCCMQIAEVEFLAVTSQADCTKAQFLSQPVNTPVLDGSTATFFTTVNGPWPLQWYADGVRIPGATQTSYTTPAVTAANADVVYTVQIVGCEESAPVQATLFTPSTTKSIGIHFGGGGANGAPTYMNADDIAGIQLQAYWNNITNNGVGAADNLAVVDSDNAASTVTFSYASTGAWGAGTGSDSATQRLLNGIAGNNAAGEISTFTFTNVPAGSHAVLVYAVSPPAQVQNNRFTIGAQTYYMRTMTSDEYKGAPGFYRSSSTTVASPAVGNVVRFDGVQAVNGAIQLSVECLTTFDRETGVNAIQLLLNAPPVGDPPAITAQPVPTVGPEGGIVMLNVTAVGEGLTYRWRKNGFNLPNGAGVSGATTAKLTISPFGANHSGIYSVAVFSPAGSVVSANAAVSVSTYNINDGVIGYWKLNESSGLVAANSATGGRPAQIVSGSGLTSWQAGRVGNSLYLDASDFAYVTNYTKPTTQIGCAVWVKVLDLGGPVDFTMTVIRNAEGALTFGENIKRGQFELGLVPDNGVLRPMAAVGLGANVARVTSTQAMPLSTWHLLAFTADGAQVRLFLDGQQVASMDYLPAPITVPDMPWLSIGAWLTENTNTVESDLILDQNGPGNYLGELDEIVLWNRTLTTEEMTKMYTAGVAGQPFTTVVLEPPVFAPNLSATTAGGNITLTWDRGVLISSPSINGPWSTNSTPSPLTEPTTGAAKFYRAVVP